MEGSFDTYYYYMTYVAVVVMGVAGVYTGRMAKYLYRVWCAYWTWCPTSPLDDVPNVIQDIPTFRNPRHYSPVTRKSTGVTTDLVDYIITQHFAPQDWRSTLCARLLSPRYAHHPDVIRAMCWVPGRITLEQTLMRQIGMLRIISHTDPESLVVCFYSDKLVPFRTRPSDFFKILQKVYDPCTLLYRNTYDVSDTHLPRFESHGPCTLSLYCIQQQKWHTFNFQTHTHADSERTLKQRVTACYTDGEIHLAYLAKDSYYHQDNNARDCFLCHQNTPFVPPSKTKSTIVNGVEGRIIH